MSLSVKGWSIDQADCMHRPEVRRTYLSLITAFCPLPFCLAEQAVVKIMTDHFQLVLYLFYLTQSWNLEYFYPFSTIFNHPPNLQVAQGFNTLTLFIWSHPPTFSQLTSLGLSLLKVSFFLSFFPSFCILVCILIYSRDDFIKLL